jgi:hypothetical protein
MPTASPARVAKSILVGVAVSASITIVASLAVFPIALIALSSGFLGAFVVSALVPVLCDVFVWRTYFARSSRATQLSLMITGLALSFALAILVWSEFVLALLGEA